MLVRRAQRDQKGVCRTAGQGPLKTFSAVCAGELSEDDQLCDAAAPIQGRATVQMIA